MNTMTTPPPYAVTGSQRFISALIDYLPMFVISMIISVPMLIHYFSSMQPMFTPSGGSPSDAMYSIVAMFEGMKTMMKYQCIGMIASYLYFLCKDIFGGRSPGKRSQGLQLVMKKDGGPVSYPRMVLRNITIIVWFVELIMILVNPQQRLGDLMCGTTVVRANEHNQQQVDNNKAAVTILVVFVALCIFAFLYYKVLELFFDFYINLLSNTM